MKLLRRHSRYCQHQLRCPEEKSMKNSKKKDFLRFSKIFYLLSLADVLPSKSLNSNRVFLKERQWKIFKTKQLFMDFLPPHSDWPHLLRQLLSPYGRQCSYQQEDAKESTNKQTVQMYLFTTIQYIICTFSFLI